MSTKIKVTINEDASLEYDVKGVKGKSCEDVTGFIDKLGQVTSRKHTEEHRQREINPKQRTRLKR